jgi:hypothetical protein
VLREEKAAVPAARGQSGPLASRIEFDRPLRRDVRYPPRLDNRKKTVTQTSRRISYVFLCALPFLDVVVISMRGLRIPGIYQAVGGLLFAVILIAAWTLGARVIGSRAAGRQRLAAAGALLILPWAINSLLWVGLGAPFQASKPENYMRFLVLLPNSIVVASAFIALKQELYDAGERFYSTLGLAASISAGTAYFVCMSLIVASHISSTKEESFTGYLNGLFSVMELFACVLTYVATQQHSQRLWGKSGGLEVERPGLM